MSSINPTTNSQQEITTNNARLAAKHAHLTATLHDLRTQHAALVARARLPSGLDFPTDWSPEQKAAHALESARSVVKDHIALLHKCLFFFPPRPFPLSSKPPWNRLVRLKFCDGNCG